MNFVYKVQGRGKAMIVEKARAKVNLSLDITGKRPNGYHEVKMIMQTISLCDDLEFEKGEEGSGVILSTDNEFLNSEQSAGSDNLITKAIRKLSEKTGKSFDVKITLTKRIPLAAGLAGGSSDAAAALRGVNRLFELKLSNEELCEVAVSIGADVPFCVEGGLCLCEGIGEKLTRLNRLPSFPTVICKPPVFVSTKEVYEEYDALSEPYRPDVDEMTDAIKAYDGEKVAKLLGNTLEEVTGKKYPVISEIEEKLKEAGAVNAVMSGSGPTVFGMFNSMKEADAAAELLKEHFPGFEIFSTKFDNEKQAHFE